MEHKDKRKNLFIVAGVVFIVIALTADVTGLGKDPGFGYQQISLLIVGLLVVLWGATKKQ